MLTRGGPAAAAAGGAAGAVAAGAAPAAAARPIAQRHRAAGRLVVLPVRAITRATSRRRPSGAPMTPP
jgi:hypothetical protein